MNTKIYLNEWFVNAGIIGFIRILKHNNDDFLTIKDNYIEFDTQNLKKFHEYYFNYFFDKYNVAKKIENRIEVSFEKIKSYIVNDSSKKDVQDKLKNEKKYIKQTLKSQLDKIKKIDEIVYAEMQEKYNQLDKIKTVDDLNNLEEIKECFVKNSYKDEINKKITSNLFKRILNNYYFGQPSFLNVVKSSLSYEEQQNLFYKDYISNIIEENIIKDIIQNKYGIDELQKLLNEKCKDALLTDEYKKIYSDIEKKYLKKGKSMDDIIAYLKKTHLKTCSVCCDEHIVVKDYTESNFIPLALSTSNAINFCWNLNPKIPLCDICKLILFCIPAGVTTTTKIIKENNTYKEKEVLSFVNCDTNVETLLKTNNDFANNSKKDKTQYNPYGDLILDIVKQERKISNWELQNIFVIEFEAEYSGYSRLQYFNIKRNVAMLFSSYSNLLNNIKDYKYKLQIMDYILNEKNFTNIINERLRNEIFKDNPYGFDSYLATKIQYTLRILNKEECNVEDEIKKANGKVHLMYTLGNEIHDKLKKDNNENKLDGYIYKMLNCIKTGNQKDFTDIAIRVIWSAEKDVPEILVKNNENVNWQELGHSFIAGLTSSKYVKENDKEETKNV